MSIASAVLPTLRSPIISSRWPRPIGIAASMAITPVQSVSIDGFPFDDFRCGAKQGQRWMDWQCRSFIERIAERIDNAAQRGRPDRQLRQTPLAPDAVPFTNVVRMRQQDDARAVFGQVVCHSQVRRSRIAATPRSPRRPSRQHERHHLPRDGRRHAASRHVPGPIAQRPCRDSVRRFALHLLTLRTPPESWTAISAPVTARRSWRVP